MDNILRDMDENIPEDTSVSFSAGQTTSRYSLYLILFVFTLDTYFLPTSGTLFFLFVASMADF